MTELPNPHIRADQIGRSDLEGRLRSAITEGALSNGWLIAGPAGSGKGTLAYRVARALLDPAALAPGAGLAMPPDARTFRLIAERAHPDLFIAERLFDEENKRYQSEITIETIRRLSAFLSKTAAFGGWRVAIIDAADDLNRNSANALLKSLEEPPARTALLLIAHRPGRLLATIRSRCRRIDLRPLPHAEIVALIRAETPLGAEEAELVAVAAEGRPGHALSLAAGDGAGAIALARDFIDAALAGRDVAPLGGPLLGKAASGKWETFTGVLLDALARAASAAGRGAAAGRLAGAAPAALVEAHERLAALSGRGEALNLDRAQIFSAMGRALGAALRAP